MVSTAQYTVQILDMSRRPPHQGTKTVEANSPKEAAEVALGFEVKETGPNDELVARISFIGRGHKAKFKNFFRASI